MKIEFNLIKYLALWSLCIVSMQSYSQTSNCNIACEPLWNLATNYQLDQEHILYDIDGDGNDEIINRSYSSIQTSVVFTVDFHNDPLMEEVKSSDAYDMVSQPVIFDYDGDGQDDLVVTDKSDIILLDIETLLAKKCFSELDQLTRVSEIYFFDINNDGLREIIIASTENLSVYTLDFKLLHYSELNYSESLSRDLYFGNFDDDDFIEIIFENGHVYQYEDNEFENDYNIPPLMGFSDENRTVDVNQDGVDEFIYLSSDELLRCYDVGNETAYYEIELEYTDAYGIADIDHDNLIEIVIFKHSSNIILVYDGLTGELQSSTDNPFPFPSNTAFSFQLTLGNFDDDESIEFWYGKGDIDHFMYEFDTQTIEYIIPNANHHIDSSTSVFEDVDEDGQVEFITVSNGNHPVRSILKIYDPETNQVEQYIPHENFSDCRAVRVYDYNNDGDKDILLVGGTYPSINDERVHFLVLDGKTLTVELNKTVDYGIGDVFAVTDVNEDGIKDFLFSSFSDFFILDGSTFEQLLEADDFNPVGWPLSIKHIRVKNLDDDPAPEIVLTDGLLIVLDDYQNEFALINYYDPCCSSDDDVVVDDWDGDGKDEILYLNGNHLEILSPLTLEVLDDILYGGYSGFTENMVFEDVNGDGKKELIYSVNSGVIIHYLGERIDRINVYGFDQNDDSTVDVVDYDLDGEMDVMWYWQEGIQEIDTECIECKWVHDDSYAINPTCYEDNGMIILRSNDPTAIYRLDDQIVSDTIKNLEPGNYKVILSNQWGCAIEHTFSLDYQDDFRYFDIEYETQNPNCNQSDGVVWASASVENIQFSVADQIFIDSLPNLPEGDFTLTAYNDSGCYKEFDIELRQPLSFDILIQTKVCNNPGYFAKLIDLEADQPYEVYWDGILGNNTSDPLTPGLHTVEVVTDSCSRVKEFDVPVLVLEDILNVDVEVLKNDCGQYYAQLDTTINESLIATNFFDSDIPIIFIWDGTFTGVQSPVYSEPGIHLVSAWIGGCFFNWEYEIPKQPRPEYELDIHSASCVTEYYAEILNLQDADSYDIIWDGVSTDQLQSPFLSHGSHILELIDGNGCRYIEQFFVEISTQPKARLQIDSLNCDDPITAQLSLVYDSGDEPYQILWSNGASDVDVIAGVSPGSYSVTVTDQTGCEEVATLNVPAPYLNITYTTQDNPCYGDTEGEIELDIESLSNEYTISWDDGSIQNKRENLASGVYEVTVISNYGCNETLSIEVKSPEMIEVFATIQSDNIITPNREGSITVEIVGGIEDYQITWSNGSHGLTNSYLSAGEYTLTIRDGNWCTLDTTFIVEEIVVEEQNPECNEVCTPLWMDIPFTGNIGKKNNYIKYDYDQDGEDEYLTYETASTSSSFGAGRSFIYVFDYNVEKEEFEKIHSTDLISATFTDMARGDLDGDGKEELVFSSRDWTFIYDLSTLTQIDCFRHSWHGATPSIEMQIFDFDLDGQNEILMLNGNTFYVYDPIAHIIEFELEHDAGDFDIGNVDDDPNLEFVLSNGQVYEYDGENYILESDLELSRTDFIKLWDTDGDGKEEAIIEEQHDVFVYDLDTGNQKFEISLGSNIWIVNDLRLISLDDFSDKINIYNLSNGSRIKSMSIDTDPYFSSLYSLFLDDFDNDDQNEILASFNSTFNIGSLRLYNLSNGHTESSTERYSGPFDDIHLVDIDQDNSMEIISLTGEGFYFNENELKIKIYDAQSKILERTIDLTSDQYEITTASLDILDYQNDGDLDIVITQHQSSDLHVIIYDGTTGVPELEEVNQNGFSSMQSSQLYDIDEDGLLDVIVASSEHLSIYNLDNLSTKWTSYELVNNLSVQGIEVGNVDLDEASEIILCKGYIHFFDDHSHEYQLTQSQYDNYTATTIFDWDNDGINEIIGGTSNGNVHILTSDDMNIIDTIDVSNASILGMSGGDIDQDGVEELLITSLDSLFIHKPRSNTTVSHLYGVFVGRDEGLAHGDINGDGNHEVFIGTEYSLMEVDMTCFECDWVDFSPEYANPTCYEDNGWILAASADTTANFYLNGEEVTDTLKNLGTGEYLFTVTNALGCELEYEVSLEYPYDFEVEEFEVEWKDPICGSDGIIYTKTLNTSLLFMVDGVEFQDSMIGLNFGNHTLVAFNENGCYREVQVVLDEPVTLSYDLLISGCGPEDYKYIDLRLSHYYDHDPLIYWNDTIVESENFNAYIIPTEVGVGTLEARMDTCSIIEEIEITPIDPLSSLEFDLVYNDHIGCNQENTFVTLENYIGGPGPVHTYWNGVEGLGFNTIVEEGSHVVEVTDATGCKSVEYFEVTKDPIISYDFDIVYGGCQNPDENYAVISNIQNIGSIHTISWDGTIGTQTSPILGQGFHNFEITYDNNCSESFTFEVEPIPTLEANLIQTQHYCDEDNLASIEIEMLSGTAPYEYVWSNNVSSSNIAENLSWGNYQVTITDAENCQGIHSLYIQSRKVFIDAIPTDLLCYQDATGEIEIEIALGEPPYEFLLDGVESNQIINQLNAGDYEVIVIDNNGCTASQSVTISEPPPLTISASITHDSLVTSSLEGMISTTVTGGVEPYDYLWETESIESTISELEAGIYTLTLQDANDCQADTTFVVESIACDRVDLGVAYNHPSCNEDNGWIVLFSEDSTANIYLEGNVVTDTLQYLSPGNYQFSISNDQGCQMDSVITLEYQLVDLDQITIEIQDPICGNDGVISVTSLDPNLTFTLDGEELIESISGLDHGEYQLVVVNTDACSSQISLSLEEPVIPLIDILATGCGPEDHKYIELSLMNDLEHDPIILWNDTIIASNSLNQYLINTEIGIGILEIQLEECSISQSIEITPIDPLNTIQFDLTYDSIPCNATGTELIIENIENGSNSYQVFLDEVELFELTATVSEGLHTIEVMDTSGCLTTQQIEVFSEPLISYDFEIINGSCSNPEDNSAVVSNVENSGQNISISWDDMPGDLTSPSLGQGSHSLEIIYGDNCIETLEFFIDSKDSLEMIINQSNHYCDEINLAAVEIEVLNGTTPYDYDWSGNISESSIAENLIPGNYELTITDAENCQGVASFTITDSQLEAEFMTTDVLCSGDTTGMVTIETLTGEPPYIYQIDGIESDQVISNLQAGIYDVTVIDSIGCSITQSITIGEPNQLDIIAEITQDHSSTSSLDGSISVTITGGVEPYTYLWSNGDEDSLITDLPVGNYALTVEDSNGCLIDSTFTIDAISSISTLQKAEIFIYPNPTTQTIYLESTRRFDVDQLTLYSLDGKMIRNNFDKLVGSKKYTLNLDFIPNGIYILVIESKGIAQRHKIIILD